MGALANRVATGRNPRSGSEMSVGGLELVSFQKDYLT